MGAEMADNEDTPTKETLSTDEILLKYATGVTTASTKERLSIIGNVIACAEKTGSDGLTDKKVKGIFKLLTQVIGRYRDKKSCRVVRGLVDALAKNHLTSTAQAALAVLAPIAEIQRKIATFSRSLSGDALFASEWTCVILTHLLRKGDQADLADRLVGLLCELLYGALGSTNKPINEAAFRKLRLVFLSVPESVDSFITAMLKMESSISHIPATSLVLRFLRESKNQDRINKHKRAFLELYVKQVVGTRARPCPHILVCSAEILRHCDHADFKELVMPAVQKAMLRNPEIIIDTVGSLLKSTTIDLSQYAGELAEMLGAQLSSKEEVPRKEAVVAFQNLALQCSDSGAVEKLVSHLFAVLEGKEGKLATADQKIAVLQAVGNVSNNAVTGSVPLQNLSSTVAECFLPTLQQEVHEGTLVHALSMLSLWCAKFYTKVPDKLVQWFKKAMSQKTSTSSVRNAYYLCMNASFHKDTLPQAGEVVSLCLAALERASKSPGQVGPVTEAISAASLLCRLAGVDINTDSKLDPFWAEITQEDPKKHLLVQDKILSGASEETLQTLVSLSEKLIMEFPSKIKNQVAVPYYRVLINCATHRSWLVRRHTMVSVRRILSSLGGAAISVELVREFSTFMESQAAPVPAPDLEAKESGVLAGLDPGWPLLRVPRVLVDALAALCAVPKPDPTDAQNIAMASFLMAHHPVIYQVDKAAWVNIIMKLGLKPEEFVTKNNESLLQHIQTGEPLPEGVRRGLSTLVLVAPDVVLPCVLDYVRKLLSDDNLVTITVEECNIFLTPDGELYDNSIIENAMKSQVKDVNIKRENKLYSYAEQIDIMKEQEKKKKQQAKPQLTKKQEEMVAAVRQRESAIRMRLRSMDSKLQCACACVGAVVEGSLDETAFYLRELCQLLIPLLQSPLAAPRISQVLLQLFQAAIPQRELGRVLGNVTIRLLHPAMEVDKSWTAETEGDQAKRVLEILVQEALPGKEEDDGSALFPATTFNLAYFFLTCVLRMGGHLVGGDEATLAGALKLILAHAAVRRSKPLSEKDKYDPDLLPREQMMELCLSAVGELEGSLQQAAIDALLAVATCADGSPNATEATHGEIRTLLRATHAPQPATRDAALRALDVLSLVLPGMDEDEDMGLDIARHIWICCNDEVEHIKDGAEKLREKLGLQDPPEALCLRLCEDACHRVSSVRHATAEALAQTLTEHPQHIGQVLQLLLDKYEEKLYMPPPVLDHFGRMAGEQPRDDWEARSGVALTLAKMAPLLPSDQISPLFDFFVAKSLHDRSPEVRSQMRDAALAAVNHHGSSNVGVLLPLFETFLQEAPNEAQYDTVRESVVILMGNLARHLEASNPKVKPIVAMLIAALSTPSQEVQEAVANCLPHLVPSIKADTPDLLKRLMTLLLTSENFGERKGAAYGLAGLVKGMGILALKQQNVMDTLTDAIQDKKNPRKREGALLAFEMLCTMLGRLFEPYIVNIIKHLLLCFGDGNQHVREAADDCAKAVMRNLSGHGVKLVMPFLLKGLEEDSWRTKTGSVELLGAMAYCAPKQLSACLPSIVPKLTEVLADSHMKVQQAGSQALQQIGNVIRNPEIQAIVKQLLNALQEPDRYTTTCLKTLLQTKFVHFVDAPSLALIMPVIQRAFQDRTTETRKMAAQIMGNMYSLTDQKDLAPYLPTVIPGLKQCLLDPVPEVRTVSARALGAMVKGIGESSFDDLLPWLMEKLVSENSAVDRSGAAQGLSEVIGGMGQTKLATLMPDIINTAVRTDLMPHVRDGYIMTYIYLPAVFGQHFIQYVGPIIPSILKALSDESEFVRETALRAGQRIISLYANTAVELLLPQLENGLFDDNWRIRYSSVQLLGDLLYKLSGVSGKKSTESANEDDNFGTESSHQLIMKSLGSDRRNRVLAGLYMGRSDTALLVRQSALHVWKVIVSNTPRTLREIMGTLFHLLLSCLASTSHDKRTVAARTLGDLVRKLGERVLPEIIPILENGLDSDHSDQRQGVCIGLSEIMASTSREHVTAFADILIPAVRRALGDPLAEVREAAAKTFDNLHNNIGQRALDEILPDLLNKLDDPATAEASLDGLKQVMSVKSKAVLPYLVPQLIKSPVNTRALSLLTSVAGEALTRHLTKILPAMLSALAEKAGTSEENEELSYCRTVVLSVEDPMGVRTIMEDLLAARREEDNTKCWATVTILHAFCSQSSADISEYIPQLFHCLISLFTRTDERLLLAAWNCLDAITKNKLDNAETLQYISEIRQAIKFVISDFKGPDLPGFSIPKKGITPLLTIFREGLLAGQPEGKEAAAVGLGEVIRLTSPEALKPSVVAITGPLIRILGDRFAPSVKVAVLETLTLLLAKVGVMLKPFLPQLQTTFVKALNDPNRSVRLRAAEALGKLIVIHARVDPLFTEILTAIKGAEDSSVKDTLLQAMRFCANGAGDKLTEASRKPIVTLLLSLLATTEDSTRMAAAGCLGTLATTMPDAELTDLLISHLLDVGSGDDWMLRHGRSACLSVLLKEAPTRLLVPSITQSVLSAVYQLCSADRVPICLTGLRSAFYILVHYVCTSQDAPADLLSTITRGMKHDSNDVKQLVGLLASYLCASCPATPDPVMKALVPALVNGTKEKNSLVRANSEYALVALLHVKEGDSCYQHVLTLLDTGMRESLREVHGKALKKLAGQPDPPKEEIDDTLLQ